MVDLYKQVYGIEEARNLWQQAFNYYDSEIAYLARFRGSKAEGVRQEMQNDLQIVSLLKDQAARTLGDTELAAKAEAVLQSFSSMYY